MHAWVHAQVNVVLRSTGTGIEGASASILQWGENNQMNVNRTVTYVLPSCCCVCFPLSCRRVTVLRNPVCHMISDILGVGVWPKLGVLPQPTLLTRVHTYIHHACEHTYVSTYKYTYYTMMCVCVWREGGGGIFLSVQFCGILPVRPKYRQLSKMQKLEQSNVDKHSCAKTSNSSSLAQSSIARMLCVCVCVCVCVRMCMKRFWDRQTREMQSTVDKRGVFPSPTPFKFPHPLWLCLFAFVCRLFCSRCQVLG